MITIDKLTKDFDGVRALNEVSVTLDAPIVGIIGPNGAGKTTLLNVMSGFLPPTAGKIEAFGADLLRMTPHKRARWGVRRTFQTEQIVEDLSVWDNVATMLDSAPAGPLGRNETVAQALDYVGLLDGQTMHRMGKSLNLYERRITEIGRTIVGQPRLILMDEPGAGLSQSEVEQLHNIIVGIPDFCGATVALIDHDVELIARTCEKTMVLDFGTLIAYGKTADVLADGRVRAAYLGEEV